MPEITNAELNAALKWFYGPVIVTKPKWIWEARIILHHRVKGRSLRQITKVLDRVLGGKYNPMTVNRRLIWAIDTWRIHK